MYNDLNLHPAVSHHPQTTSPVYMDGNGFALGVKWLIETLTKQTNFPRFNQCYSIGILRTMFSTAAHKK